MIKYMLGLFGGSKYFIIAIVALSVMASSLGWLLKQSYEERGELAGQNSQLKDKLKTAQKVLIDEAVKRQDLADDIVQHIIKRAHLETKLGRIVQSYEAQLVENDRLSAENLFQADKIRQGERKDGQARKTFDTRGLR